MSFYITDKKALFRKSLSGILYRISMIKDYAGFTSCKSKLTCYAEEITLENNAYFHNFIVSMKEYRVKDNFA